MATTVAKGQPVELTSHTPTLMDVEMDASAQSAEPEEDLYTRLKTLQRQLEFYEIQVLDRKLIICHQHTEELAALKLQLSCTSQNTDSIITLCSTGLVTDCRRSTSKRSNEA